MLRIGFEHKQSTLDKDQYCLQNNILQVRHQRKLDAQARFEGVCIYANLFPLTLQARAVPAKEYIFGEGRAQVVCCLIAAYAMCQFPLDLDLSDGKRHHLLRLRGDRLLEYLIGTPKQV